MLPQGRLMGLILLIFSWMIFPWRVSQPRKFMNVSMTTCGAQHPQDVVIFSLFGISIACTKSSVGSSQLLYNSTTPQETLPRIMFIANCIMSRGGILYFSIVHKRVVGVGTSVQGKTSKKVVEKEVKHCRHGIKCNKMLDDVVWAEGALMMKFHPKKTLYIEWENNVSNAKKIKLNIT